MDDRPVWARRIRVERKARCWSQSDVVGAMRSADDRLAGQESLLRQWRRWESGEIEPGNHYKRLIARTFGLATAVLFPPDRADTDCRLVAATGMDTVELIDRLRASDLSSGVVAAMEITADRLACDYDTTLPPAGLHAQARVWLERLVALRDARLTLVQHRDLLSLAGQVAILAGCLEYDMGRRATAEATRRAALALGTESGNPDVIGWAHEMRAWYALTSGNHRGALDAAEEGLVKVGTGHGVVIQLAAHRAKAWARLGDRRQLELALAQGRALLDVVEQPADLQNHFVVDTSKWNILTLDCYRFIEDDPAAQACADDVIRSSTAPDGTIHKPMRVAEARITQGVLAARAGDLDAALLRGRQALAGPRRSLPSLTMHTQELVAALRDRFPHERRVTDYTDELHTGFRN